MSSFYIPVWNQPTPTTNTNCQQLRCLPSKLLAADEINRHWSTHGLRAGLFTWCSDDASSCWSWCRNYGRSSCNSVVGRHTTISKRMTLGDSHSLDRIIQCILSFADLHNVFWVYMPMKQSIEIWRDVKESKSYFTFLISCFIDLMAVLEIHLQKLDLEDRSLTKSSGPNPILKQSYVIGRL